MQARKIAPGPPWSAAVLGTWLSLFGCSDPPKPAPRPCETDAGSDASREPRPSGDDGHSAARAACSFGPSEKTEDTVAGIVPHDQLPFDHVVVLMLENRGFDHYMSQLGPPWDVATAQTNPDLDGTQVSRLHETHDCAPEDLNHEWEAAHMQYDHGLLDGFVRTNAASRPTEPRGRGTMNYYDEQDLPVAYWLARKFASSDRYFSSTLGPTWPNRYFFFGATAAGVTTTPGASNIRQLTLPPYDQPTLFDQLGPDAVVYSPNTLNLLGLTLHSHTQLILKNPSIPVRTLDDFESDTARNTLPKFAFIEPLFAADGNTGIPTEDHAPANVRAGQALVAKIVGDIARNRETWMKTVLFVVYDENGGFYDHVPPPPACVPDGLLPPTHAYDRYGFRVPLFIVSAWARGPEPGAPAYVSHQIADHTSITRFIQYRFGLGALTKRDANAWPLLDAFDFTSAHFPDPPTDIPTVDIDGGVSCNDR